MGTSVPEGSGHQGSIWQVIDSSATCFPLFAAIHLRQSGTRPSPRCIIATILLLFLLEACFVFKCWAGKGLCRWWHIGHLAPKTGNKASLVIPSRTPVPVYANWFAINGKWLHIVSYRLTQGSLERIMSYSWWQSRTTVLWQVWLHTRPWKQWTPDTQCTAYIQTQNYILLHA